jgi:RNA 3'-terminal phosphate cyclase (ATP)
LQTLLIPLALADGASSLLLRGGIHVEWSPPFDDLAASYLSALPRTGLCIDAELKRFGWFPAGSSEIVCEIAGRSAAHGATRPTPIEMTKRGPLQISGRAVAANLPGRIPQRMANRARARWFKISVRSTTPAT